MMMTRLLFILTIALAPLTRAADSTNTVAVGETVAITNQAPAPAISGTNGVVVSTNAPVDPRSLEAFKIVFERNIFDPNRRPRTIRSGGAPTDIPKPVRTESFTLLGAMSYSKGAFAFFEGTKSEYRKSVKAGDTIADYKVASVTSTNVALELGDKKVELPVGSQMRKRGEEPWELNSRIDATAATTSDSSSSTTDSTSKSDSSPSTEGVSDVVKRLMEKRNREK